ncbi:LicD family protein [Helicobacter sp.]|uniref:LicD family protein n=1 Tax=Helicobacter sp. TaxID=218 RepID=UPI0019AB2F38|nr:LicD family protein [Helicobacter sp.]MBD5164682.1 LicD family protein [Helicobacter sp.]
MFSTKEIYQSITNSGKGKELSKENLMKLQNHLIGMYRDIEEVCNRHGLEVCFAYGNVIGAMRHNGWIPWDDDLDLHMSRKDYDLFLSKYASELPPKYKVSSYLSEGGSYARFAKIIDTTTVYVPLTGEKNSESGVFIDIFPIDNVKAQPRLNILRRYWAYFLMYTGGSVQQAQKGSKGYKNLMFSTKAGRMNWRLRQFWGKLFSFASYRTWNKWVELFGQNRKETGYVHVMSDLSICYRMIPKENYFPFKEIELPQIGKIKIPNRYDEYLTLSYGDWRIVPEETDKWHHYVSEFRIDKNN